ncbi:MAG: molybdopterin-dependent oxidoreductase [Chloroflexi bacterium]|nr:molybdopterin-dependent oxidoreductase [Chloroflexota bacterium]
MASQSAFAPAKANREDVWVHSACDMCFSSCGILAHRVDGVIVKIEGDPDCPHNNGKLCAKGMAALMAAYDPNRVTSPLKRTNPQKGIGVDPGWQKITWDEALDIITQRLSKVRKQDPRKLVIATWDQSIMTTILRAFASSFGTPNYDWSGYYCGNYLHSTMYLTNGSFHSSFDLDYCNYCILLGNQMGFMVGLSPNLNSQKMAEARMRGMKVVAVDPVGTTAAAKADEWVPIRPGTDAAFILGLVNVLLNELGIYDAEFLAQRTNAAYLVGPDEYYVRDPASHKPLVWDKAQGRAIPFDAAKQPALEGDYQAAGVSCQPAFSRLKEHVKRYAPDYVSQVTSVPAATIRRIAREFGENARIGSTITIEGQELPYRPVAVNIYRGAGAHKHGALTGLAVQTLNMLMGAYYVPGGHRGENLVGPKGAWGPKATADGLVLPPEPIGHGVNYYESEIRAPESLNVAELFPISTNRSPMNQLATTDSKQFKLPYDIEVMIQCRRNLMTNAANRKAGTDALSKVPFLISFNTLLDEVSEFADIVLPDTHSLERLDMQPNRMTLSVSVISGYYYWGLRQPVITPPEGVRSWRDVLLELADRLGFLDNVNQSLNVILHLKPPHDLKPGQKYDWDAIFDRWAKSQFGEDKGLAWFKENGYHKVKRSVFEKYPLTQVNVRFPVYFENVKVAGEKVKAVTDELDMDWDTSDYQPLPDWKPCPAYNQAGSEYDLWGVNYKLPFHYQSWTTENPWLNEVGERHLYAYKVMINTQSARSRGIRDGDPVWIESIAGKVKGQAKVTECIHPEVVGIAGVFGAWGPGKPVAKGKGIHFNSLIPIDLEHIDAVSTSLDSCVRVKVTRAEA